MRPASRPLPEARPFLTFYTPAICRPAGLMACMRSVAAQTAADDVEHLIVPDYVGYGIVGGLYGRIPWYAEACRGRYVHVLADDDTLPDIHAVERLRSFAERKADPEVIVARVEKGPLKYPTDPLARPAAGTVDMGCYVIRSDVWRRHARDYGARYEGDVDHAVALWEAGYRHAYCDLLLVRGDQRHGRAEGPWE